MAVPVSMAVGKLNFWLGVDILLTGMLLSLYLDSFDIPIHPLSGGSLEAFLSVSNNSFSV